MQRSIRWRTAIILSLIILAAFIIISFILGNVSKNSIIENWKEILSLQTENSISYFQSKNLTSINKETVEDIFENDISLNGFIVFYYQDGKVIASQNSEIENQIFTDLPLSNRNDIQETGLTCKISTPTNVDNDYLQCIGSVSQNDDIIGYISHGISLQTINSEIREINKKITLSTLITGTFLILITVLVIAINFRPLKELSERVNNLSVDSSIKHKHNYPIDEVAKLDHAFSHLSTRLNNQINELEAQTSKLTAVLSQMTDGILIVDSEGYVQLMNPAAQKMFDVFGSDAEGRSLIEVLRNHQMIELWETCKSTQRQQSTTLEIGPNQMFIQSIAAPLHQTEEGTVMFAFQDLTRIRRLEMIRRDFVSNVSHELRTPLASLKALTETLYEGALDDPPAAKRFLLRMENEIDNLTQMVQELLELSRIESGRVPLEYKSVRPINLINKAYERMQLQSERAGLDLSYQYEENLPDIHADETRIGQVFINLIHNAIKFTEPGGRIEINAKTEGNFVMFSIHDSGVGIAQEDLSRIFERFYKADRARSGGGTGLGLSIARHLIESHGGKIWAESASGNGSTFFFTIPKVIHK